MIYSQKPAMSRLLVLGALALLCAVPSRGFVPSGYTRRLPSPLLASTTSGRIDAIGDREVPDVRVGVSFSRQSPNEDMRAKPSVLATPRQDASPEETTSNTSEKPPPLVYGETAARSFVKALVWRLTAAVVTLISGLAFSGSLSTAMSIVGSDFLTKSGFMFLGERLWNKVKWGQGKKGDSAKRSLAKAVLWRIFAASNTLICGVFLAGDLTVASKIAGTDTVFKTALFFVNERIWSTIKWGKKYEPEYFI